MNNQTDPQLLRAYAEHRAEPAFAELVRRHVDFVYSAGLRMVCDSHLAKDVTQGVFVALAKNAALLADRPVLSGWLHRTAQNIAAQTVRTDVRRRAREQEAAAMNELLATETDDAWEHIAPHLDAALGELSEPDRDALLLRYFERKSASEMAQTLGISDDAAQKRVSRAVERLREFFSKRNVTIGASGLAVLISANAVQAAPIGLAATISAAAVLAGTAVHTSTVIAATKTIAMTTLQKSLVTAVLAAAVGTGIFEAHQASQLREQVQTLQQQQAPLAEQIRQLQKERDDTTNRLAVLLAENKRLESNPNQTEILKLRAEVTRLQAEANDPTQRAAMSVTKKVNLLKARLEQNPNWKIPELQFITEKDWAAASWDADLSTDDGVREALSRLRETAINTFLNEMMKNAFKKYLAANGNVLPTDLYQLKPFFDQPVTDDMLKRYQLLQSGTPNKSADLVHLIANADEEYDSNHGMSINGAWGGRFNRVQGAVEVAVNAFTVDHAGQMPGDSSQIMSYLKTPIDVVTVQKYLNQIAANPPPPEAATLAPALKAYYDANNGQMPKSPTDLLPYLTTPEQKAAFQKLEQGNPVPK